jgi:tetratricopeptide (TPR) repeat protein
MSELRKKFFDDIDASPEDINLSAFEREAKSGWEQYKGNSEEYMVQIDKKIDARTSSVANRPKMALLRRIIMLGIAASFIGLLGFAAYNNLYAPQRIEKLFAQNFKPADNFTSTVRGENSVSNPLLEKAEKAYNELDYPNAILYYKQLLNKDPNQDKYILFLGVSYLADNQTEQAIRLFNNSPYKNSMYAEDINWYLALAYIKKGDTQTAAILLQNLAKVSDYYKDQAWALYKKL